MEHLALYINLSLKDFCDRLKNVLALSEFIFDHENETEWGESHNDGMKFNVSKPIKPGLLNEWDKTIPKPCNFGISITQNGIDPQDIADIGQQMAKEFRTSVFYYRTWLAPGKNIKREIEFKHKA